MSTIGKCSKRKEHKWYLGLPEHIKLAFILLDLVVIGILINYYILLVLHNPYMGHPIAVWFAYGLPGLMGSWTWHQVLGTKNLATTDSPQEGAPQRHVQGNIIAL